MATTIRDILTPWSERNPIAYAHHANRKNIGRAEYKGAWELRKLGYDAVRNPIPNGKQDILIVGKLGVEVKELTGSPLSFRMSGAGDILKIIDEEVFTPNEKFVKKNLPEIFTDFRRDTITTLNLRKIPRVDNRMIVKKIFAGYGISHLLVATVDGFALLDQKAFTRHFVLYRLDRGYMHFAFRRR